MESLKWIVVVFAALAMALLLTDLIVNIKKRKNTKINIIGLVFLSLSIACFVPTIILGDEASQLLDFGWIGFLLGYFVCDVIMAVVIGKDNSRKKRDSKAQAAAENQTPQNKK